MCEITYLRTAKHLELTLKGHADGSGDKQPVVCSAISALVYAIAYAVELWPEGELEQTVRLEPGDCTVAVSAENELTDISLRHTFDACALTMASIADRYPEKVQLEIKN